MWSYPHILEEDELRVEEEEAELMETPLTMKSLPDAEPEFHETPPESLPESLETSPKVLSDLVETSPMSLPEPVESPPKHSEFWGRQLQVTECRKKPRVIERMYETEDGFIVIVPDWPPTPGFPCRIRFDSDAEDEEQAVDEPVTKRPRLLNESASEIVGGRDVSEETPVMCRSSKADLRFCRHCMRYAEQGTNYCKRHSTLGHTIGD